MQEHKRVQMRGRVRCQLVNERTGEIESEEEFNFLMPAMETYMAQVLAGESAIPGYIAVGTGASLEYGIANRDDFEIVGDLFHLLGQRITPTSFIEYQTVLVPMKRIGAGAASVWLTIEGVSGSDPNNTPITNGTSQIVIGAAIPTDDFAWVPFTFTPHWTGVTNAFIVIHVDDYTYDPGVDEIQVGHDAVSVDAGTYRGDDVGDGSSWGPHPGANAKMPFRLVRVMDPDNEDNPSAISSLQPITTLGALSNETRLLALFGTSVANDRLREMYLLRDSELNNSLAIASINVNKTSQQVMLAYWLISFERDPEDL